MTSSLDDLLVDGVQQSQGVLRRRSLRSCTQWTPAMTMASGVGCRCVEHQMQAVAGKLYPPCSHSRQEEDRRSGMLLQDGYRSTLLRPARRLSSSTRLQRASSWPCRVWLPHLPELLTVGCVERTAKVIDQLFVHIRLPRWIQVGSLDVRCPGVSRSPRGEIVGKPRSAGGSPILCGRPVPGRIQECLR